MIPADALVLLDTTVWIAPTASPLDVVLVTTDGDFDPLVPSYFHRVKVEGTTGASSWD